MLIHFDPSLRFLGDIAISAAAQFRAEHREIRKHSSGSLVNKARDSEMT